MILGAQHWPNLSQRSQLAEKMDDPACDQVTLERTYRDFALVNSVLSGWQDIYRREIRPRLAADRVARLLDIGFGGGDVPRMLSQWAARDGLRLEITAIDADRRAFEYVSSLPPMPGVQFRQAMSSDLVREGQVFDLVVSNHLLHHLSAAELTRLLGDSQQLCRGLVVHNDIERHGLAYALFGLGTWPLFRQSLIRHDGLISIRRSFTRPELLRLAPPGWLARRHVLFHTLLTYRAEPNA